MKTLEHFMVEMLLNSLPKKVQASICSTDIFLLCLSLTDLVLLFLSSFPIYFLNFIFLNVHLLTIQTSFTIMFFSFFLINSFMFEHQKVVAFPFIKLYNTYDLLNTLKIKKKWCLQIHK